MINKILTKLKEYQYKCLDIRLIVFVVVLTIIGIQVIRSATDSDGSEYRQLIGFALSFFIMIVIALIDYKLVIKFYWVYYIINLLLLLFVNFFGSEHGGAVRWIDIPGFQLQPSEFTKIFLILFFAKLIQKYREHLNTFKFLLASLVLLILPVLLILKQPDLSTSIVIILTFCSLMFISGLSYKIIAGLFALAVPVTIILVYLISQPDQKILEDYQYKRIVGFYNPEIEGAANYRYQQENSILAIGSGGLYGKGLNNNAITSVKNGNYLSEPQTDFIFTIVGEELGFVGGVAVILLLILIVIECFITGARAPDLVGRYICCGMGALIAFQSFINIAVVTMLIPNTGLTLPFVSYGLNSLLSLYAGIGVILNVSLQRRRNYYEEGLI